MARTCHRPTLKEAGFANVWGHSRIWFVKQTKGGEAYYLRGSRTAPVAEWGGFWSVLSPINGLLSGNSCKLPRLKAVLRFKSQSAKEAPPGGLAGPRRPDKRCARPRTPLKGHNGAKGRIRGPLLSALNESFLFIRGIKSGVRSVWTGFRGRSVPPATRKARPDSRRGAYAALEPACSPTRAHQKISPEL